LFLPGLKKLRTLYDAGFFGRVLSIRLDFGWWVFDGDLFPAQRPSWNYQKATGGGLILDMFAHWRYIFDRLLGPINAVSCRHATVQPRRIDERGRPYDVDVEDHAFAIFELEGGVLAQISSSWASRVKRDDLLQIQVDGTLGSAVAGLHRCFCAAARRDAKALLQPRAAAADEFRRAVAGSARRPPLREWLPRGLGIVPALCRRGRAVSGAAPRRRQSVQLAAACYKSHRERRWVELEPLSL
jgi:predicted dehydrogenase